LKELTLLPEAGCETDAEFVPYHKNWVFLDTVWPKSNIQLLLCGREPNDRAAMVRLESVENMYAIATETLIYFRTTPGGQVCFTITN